MKPQDKPSIIEILDAMILLRQNGDYLFRRIREDLERGLVKEARSHLDVIDLLLKARKPEP